MKTAHYYKGEFMYKYLKVENVYLSNHSCNIKSLLRSKSLRPLVKHLNAAFFAFEIFIFITNYIINIIF